MNKVGYDTCTTIEPAFQQAQREIQSQIDVWIARVAKNNKVSMSEARKLLTAKELAEFKWDVNEYIKYGKQNALDGKWMKQLENASARYHISRLEALQISIQQSLEKAFGAELDAVDDMAKKVFTDDYYHSCFEVQNGFNIGWNIGQVDDKKLAKLISKPWAADEKTFSDRIWQSKSSMISDLHTELTRTCLLGKAPDEAIRHMTRYTNGKCKNAKAQAGRLVMTEQAFFASAGQKQAFTDLDVEEYEIVATLDSRTSETCQQMDGKHFPMKDFKAGATAPPFHPWCRSCTCPYFDDEFSQDGYRASRNAEGKTVYDVPAKMTYPEWKKGFVDGDVDGLQLCILNNAPNNSRSKKATKSSKAKKEKTQKIPMTEEPSEKNDTAPTKTSEDAENYVENKLQSPSDGGIIKTIEKGKQQKHILGSNNYTDGRSYLSISENQAQDIVDRFSGTGIKIGQNKEKITADKIIGVNVNPQHKHKTLTDKAVIHYSNKGTHIVPTANELKKQSVETLTKTAKKMAMEYYDMPEFYRMSQNEPFSPEQKEHMIDSLLTGNKSKNSLIKDIKSMEKKILKARGEVK